MPSAAHPFHLIQAHYPPDRPAMATSAPSRTDPAGGGRDARKEDAAALLRAVLGEEFVAAMQEGLLKGGDFTGVVPLNQDKDVVGSPVDVFGALWV